MQDGVTYDFCPGVSITGSLTINEEMCPTIRAQANTNTPAIAVRTAQTTANGCGVSDELAHTIDTTGPEAIAYAVRMRAGCDGGGKGALVQEGVSGTLATGNDQTLFQPESSGYVVRHLTPLECERLQGFPTEVRLETHNMTADEVAICALINGDIYCDFDSGVVYGTRGPGGMKLKEPRALGTQHPSGYVHIHLSANGEKRQCRAHRIIWIAANGAIPDGMVIDHINNIKSDNRLSNLQLVTPEENSHKARADGLYLSGDDNPRTIYPAYIRTMVRHDYSHGEGSYRELAEKYGMSKARVAEIVREQDHTKVPYRGKPAEECPDGPRYKAIGNSMAVPVMRWIGERVQEVDALLSSEGDANLGR